MAKASTRKRYSELNRTRRCKCCQQIKLALSDCVPCLERRCPRGDECRYITLAYGTRRQLAEIMQEPPGVTQGSMLN